MFFDEFAILIPDPDTSRSEERFVLLGLSDAARTLVVCHCVRAEGDVIRIISARKANQESAPWNGADSWRVGWAAIGAAGDDFRAGPSGRRTGTG